MATRIEVDQRAPAKARYGPIDWMGGWKTCIWGTLAIVVLTAVHWWYIWLHAWTAGIDASSPEFTKYFRSLVWIQLILIGAGTGLWWGWLVRTGRQLVDVKVTADEEVRRIAVFWGLISMTSLTLYVMASFWPNQDGSWHQTAIRDTALTPAHIPMFYWWFPAGITMTVGTYLYGRYRLPKVYGAEKGFPWSFFFLIAASVTEVMQVAFNEWAHSLWILEEIFAAPFHWPFVFYGWLAAGIFALWAETILRLLAIEKEVEDAATVTAKAA
jgi:methane/ammonia monooxygenase subunit C